MARALVIINERVFDTDHIFIGEVIPMDGVGPEIDPSTGDLKKVNGFGYEILDTRECISCRVWSLVYTERDIAIQQRDMLVKELNDIISGKIEYTHKYYV